MGEEKNIIIYNTQDGKASVSLLTKEGTVWMNQNQLAELFDTSIPNISMHIAKILKEKELQENSVVKDYLTTAQNGKNYSVALNDKQLLSGAGTVSHAQMEKAVEAHYEKFDAQRKLHAVQQADEADMQELKALEEKIKAKPATKKSQRSLKSHKS